MKEQKKISPRQKKKDLSRNIKEKTPQEII